MTILKSLALAGIIALVGALLVGIQQYRIETYESQVELEKANTATEKKSKEDAVAANVVSQATITTLQAELKRNKDYAEDLDKRIKASEAKAKQARTDYEKLKRNSKPVRDWSDQLLPDGLRGKRPAGTGGNKDGNSKDR